VIYHLVRMMRINIGKIIQFKKVVLMIFKKKMKVYAVVVKRRYNLKLKKVIVVIEVILKNLTDSLHTINLKLLIRYRLLNQLRAKRVTVIKKIQKMKLPPKTQLIKNLTKRPSSKEGQKYLKNQRNYQIERVVR
jgi:uncharacterized membrane protein YpjA